MGVIDEERPIRTRSNEISPQFDRKRKKEKHHSNDYNDGQVGGSNNINDYESSG